MIPCGCQNTNCKEFETCCFTATEIVWATGNQDDPVHLMFVGQGAGRDEDFNMNPKNVDRQPFIGKAGAYLRNMIKFLWDEGIVFNVAISNSVRFHPRDGNGKDRNPSTEEIGDCIHLLDRDIDIIKPKTLIPLGMSTSNALVPYAPGATMGKMVGTSNIYREIKTIPLYHPSFLTRNYGKFFANQRGEYHIKCVNVLKNSALEALQ
jgi:DNA polymerase